MKFWKLWLGMLGTNKSIFRHNSDTNLGRYFSFIRDCVLRYAHRHSLVVPSISTSLLRLNLIKHYFDAVCQDSVFEILEVARKEESVTTNEGDDIAMNFYVS